MLPLLPPGTYRVEVTKQGFSSTQSDPVQVPVTDSIPVSIPIKLAGITQSVEVHGDAAPLHEIKQRQPSGTRRGCQAPAATGEGGA